MSAEEEDQEEDDYEDPTVQPPPSSSAPPPSHQLISSSPPHLTAVGDPGNEAEDVQHLEPPLLEIVQDENSAAVATVTYSKSKPILILSLHCNKEFLLKIKPAAETKNNSKSKSSIQIVS